MHNCLIVAADSLSHARLGYVLDFIFGRQLGITYQIAQNYALSEQATFTLSYSNRVNEQADINIFDHGLLIASDIKEQEIKVDKHEARPYFFGTNNVKFDLPFDLFSFAFYLLTRYEEYLPYDKDQHGRFSASQSLAYRESFLTLPLIDIWVCELRNKIVKKLNIALDTPHWVRRMTIDVDQVYAFKYKYSKFIGGLIKDIAAARTSTLWARFEYLKTKKDPFDTFDYLRDRMAGQFDQTRFFFLSHYLPPYDLNHVVDLPIWAAVVKKVSEFSYVGLHPSYGATDLATIIREKKRLELALGNELSTSRQHFIRLRLPETYRHLINAGIDEDYSMSYPDSIGFRASTSFPFHWYDLEQEKKTGLVIYPDCAMDVTLRYYMTLTPAEAMAQLAELMQHIKKVGGHFSIIWHNSSLSKAYGWHDWLPVFEYIIAAI